MSSIITLFITILNYYQIIVLLYVLSSWVPQIRTTTIGQFIGAITEPYLSIFRKIIPPLGMIDVSPIIAIMVLRVATSGLHNLLFRLL